MNRTAIARDGRRAQALEALAFERERDVALVAQLEAVVLEEEGGRVDELAFAHLGPDDVARVQEALGTTDGDGPEDENALEDDASDDSPEDEIQRLQDAIDHCRAVQHALELYVEALDGVSSSSGSTGSQPRSGTA